MNYLKNNNGFVLLISIVALILFSVIGISLISVTANGFKKNEARETNVLAVDLADKGTSYIVNDVQNKLETLIKNPIGKVAFGNALDSMLGYNSSTEQLTTSTLHCKTNQKGVTINSNKDNSYSEVCIEKVEMIRVNGVITEENKYKRLVTLRSTGVANGKVHTTTSKVVFGTDTIPDQLKYAVSTNEGGNLFLHGGIEVRGDIKTSGNLIVADRASWGTASNPNSNNTWTESVLPRIEKNNASVTPKIIIQEEKNVYQLKFNSNSNTSNFYKNTHIKGTGLSNTANYSKLTTNELINNAFFNTNNLQVIRRTIGDDQLNILAEFNKKPTGTTNVNLDLTSSNGNTNKSKAYYIRKNTNNRYGNILISNVTKFNLIGTYYVDGDVTIEDSNLYADAILYVKGNVHIDASRIYAANTSGTLFIFAEGDITFSNIHDTGSNDPQYDLKGFYYSNSNMHVLGVKSHMKITGGVSGKNIILTGVRGKGNGGSFDSKDAQKSKNARLVINYDENLIQSFTSFTRDLEEEFITTINPPEMVDRR